MIRVEVRGTEALVRRLLELGEDAPKAATRAVNRTVNTVRVALVRAIAADTGLAIRDIYDPSRDRRGRSPVSVERATWARQIGRILITGARIPIFAFKARPTKTGVTYRLPGGRGSIPGAFLATMKTGHEGVFARRGEPGGKRVRRLPIIEQFGPSLPHVVTNRGILEAQHAHADSLLAKNLDHEISFILRQRAPSDDGSSEAA